MDNPSYVLNIIHPLYITIAACTGCILTILCPNFISVMNGDCDLPNVVSGNVNIRLSRDECGCDCAPGLGGECCETCKCGRRINYHSNNCYPGHVTKFIGIGFCDPNPCLNGATCLSHASSHTCTCPFGFTRSNCETGEHELHNDSAS